MKLVLMLLITTTLFCQCKGTQTYYEILKVDETATLEEIKGAYDKLAFRLHPDKNSDDPQAAKKFQEIKEAYKVLSDKEMRENYDLFGIVLPTYESELKKIEDEYKDDRSNIEESIEALKSMVKKLKEEISKNKSELNDPKYNESLNKVLKNFKEKSVIDSEFLLKYTETHVEKGQENLVKLEAQYHKKIEILNKKYGKPEDDSKIAQKLVLIQNKLSHLKNKLNELSKNLNTLKTKLEN